MSGPKGYRAVLSVLDETHGWVRVPGVSDPAPDFAERVRAEEERIRQRVLDLGGGDLGPHWSTSFTWTPDPRFTLGRAADDRERRDREARAAEALAPVLVDLAHEEALREERRRAWAAEVAALRASWSAAWAQAQDLALRVLPSRFPEEFRQ